MQEPKRGPGRPPLQRQLSVPLWADFARYVRDNGNAIRAVRYPWHHMPNGVEPVIDTIWRGVPVEDGERVEVMHENGLWSDYE
jgi:hypothetical protein